MNTIRGVPYSRLCKVPGCRRPGQHLGSYFVGTNFPRRRDTCDMHHNMNYGINGWDYKIYRKCYCENIDGRLGFKCTSTILNPAVQIDADHWDGNHDNNDPSNIVSLCKNCHAIKTNLFKDYLSVEQKEDIGWVIPDLKTLKKMLRQSESILRQSESIPIAV